MSPIFLLNRLALLVLIALLTTPTRAENTNAFTIYGGWRTSSGFSDALTQEKVKIRDSGAISAALDLDIDGARQWQLFASQQSTSLRALSRNGSTSSTVQLKLNVTHVHVGGTYFFGDFDENYGRGLIGRGPYTVGGVGVTVLRPTSDGYATETRPSLNIGLGYLQPLGSVLALRVEGRGFFTLVGGSADLFCSGGCSLSIKGDALQQYEMMIGLSWRF